MHGFGGVKLLRGQARKEFVEVYVEDLKRRDVPCLAFVAAARNACRSSSLLMLALVAAFVFGFRGFTHRPLSIVPFGELPSRILNMNHKKELLRRLWV